MKIKAYAIVLDDKLLRAYAKLGHAKTSCNTELGEKVITCQIIYACKRKSRAKKPQHWWSQS